MEGTGTVANDKSAKTQIANEDVGAEPEQEIRDAKTPCLAHDKLEVCGGIGIVEVISRSADPECREWSKGHASAEASGIERSGQFVEEWHG